MSRRGCFRTMNGEATRFCGLGGWLCASCKWAADTRRLDVLHGAGPRDQLGLPLDAMARRAEVA